jgi:hypothetical protein
MRRDISQSDADVSPASDCNTELGKTGGKQRESSRLMLWKNPKDGRSALR